MGLFEVLTLVFVVLKLLGVIAWSWWAVFIPLYVSVGISLVLIVLMAVTSYKAERDIEQLFGGKNGKGRRK